MTSNKTEMLKTNANLFSQIPIAQKRYTCNKMTFNWSFSAGEKQEYKTELTIFVSQMQ